MKIFELTVSNLFNYSRDNEKSFFFKEAYAEGLTITLNELRIRILYSSYSPPDCQPVLNRWLSTQRGYAKAARERFNNPWEFANVIKPCGEYIGDGDSNCIDCERCPACHKTPNV